MAKHTEIRVITTPSYIAVDCPHCSEEAHIDYSDFCGMVGEPCDWRHSLFECPECGGPIEIDSIDWQ